MEADDATTTAAAAGEKMPQQRIKLPAPVANIYRAVRKLEKLYPERKFTADGHLVGLIREVIAAKHLDLTATMFVCQTGRSRNRGIVFATPNK